MGPLLRIPLIAFAVTMCLGFLTVVGKEHRYLEVDAPFFTDHFIELR